MKDLGFNSGVIQEINTSKKEFKGYFGLRKIFWTYLRKLNVPFQDDCCDIVKGTENGPVRYNVTTHVLEYYDSITKAWVVVPAA